MSVLTTDLNNTAWQWPSVGASASHEGLDSEIFDTERFPHAHTFVREAIQNILDAKRQTATSVVAKFNFYSGDLSSREKHLIDLVGKRDHCDLLWPQEWSEQKMRWLVVEDENATGLLGDLAQRKSDFWGYWLNFGRSNKPGETRGGRGIGRITFPLASEIHTVLGVTRRQGEDEVFSCGMSVLRAEEWDNKFRGSFAFYAQAENGNILELYPSEIAMDIAESFETNRYEKDGDSGLSLVIPFPRKELNEQTICAAAIENFAPAIASGELKIEVGNKTIDASSLATIASEVRDKFSNPSFQQDPKSILSIVLQSGSEADFKIDVKEGNFSGSLKDGLSDEVSEQILQKFEENDSASFLFNVPVRRNGKSPQGEVYVIIRATPMGHTPTDMFYRGGMYLPNVQAANKGDLDVFMFCQDDILSAYLNFCEGKAHLGLLENSEVLAKLHEKGYEGRIGLKRFVNTLPRKVRSLVQSDSNEPDASVFAKWFAVPNAPQQSKKKGKKKKTVIVDPPKRSVRYFNVSDLEDGFEIKANPSGEGWPLNLNVQFAYADGRTKPHWNKFDFRVKNLEKSISGAKKTKVIESAKERKAGFHFVGCDENFCARIKGFDKNRELIVHHTPLRPKGSKDD